MEFAERGLSSLAATAGGIGVGLALGLACELWIHWPLERRHASHDIHLIASLGSFMVLAHLAALGWGPDAQLTEAPSVVVALPAGLRVTEAQALAVVIAMATLVGTALLLRKALIGLEIRALGLDARLLSVLGRDVRWLRASCFALAGALGALGSLLVARDVGFSPHTGMRTVLVAVAATVIGGRYSLEGIVAGALVIGLVRGLVGWFLANRFEDAATFGLLALCMALKPEGLAGLFGGPRRVEEA
jgi:branched-subunit amino acid ABC-type transport system permease component